jgi:DNA-binding transcriptional LysR family regulator
MVTREDLEGLDHMLWHGNGPRAAVALQCNQSTISRRVQRCLGTFGLRLRRRSGGWVIQGPSLLLQMEREIHQLARVLGQHPLRLEGFPVGSSPLLKPPPPGWAMGPHDAAGIMAPLGLLKERIIDAWLTDAADDLPQNPDFPIVVWPLAQQPITLIASAQHPLVGDTNLQISDLARFPIPIVPEESYPSSHALSAQLGLGTFHTEVRRYEPQGWEGLTGNHLTLVHTTPLNARAHPDLVALDSVPLFTNRLALVCREDLATYERLQDLHCLLKARLQYLQKAHPHLERLSLLP